MSKMAVFGYQVIGTLGTNRNIVNAIVGSVFNCPVPGTANSITLYLEIGGSTGRAAKCAIYKHSDLSLVKATNERLDLPLTTPGWYTFTFPGGDPVLAAGDYILVAWGVAQGVPIYANIRWDDGDNGIQGHYEDRGYDGFPGTMTVSGHEDRKYSIYCTYTPAPIDPPTVTTQDATGIHPTIATVHGTITATGGENCGERGFDWDYDSGAPYANSWTETDSYGIGAFSHEFTGFTAGQIIYFRAKAQNSGGWGYGGEKTVQLKWTGKILGVTNPTKIIGVLAKDIAKVMGVV